MKEKIFIMWFAETVRILLHYLAILIQCMLKIMQIIIHWRVVIQITKVSTCLVIAHPVVNFIRVIWHAIYFKCSKMNTTNWSVDLLLVLPLVMTNYVVSILLSWVFLLIIYLHRRFCKLMSIFRSSYMPPLVHSVTLLLT